MVPVGDQGRAAKASSAAQPHAGGDLVPGEPDHAGEGEHAQVRQGLRMQQPLDRLVEGDAGGDEDGPNDAKPGDLLPAV